MHWKTKPVLSVEPNLQKAIRPLERVRLVQYLKCAIGTVSGFFTIGFSPFLITLCACSSQWSQIWIPNNQLNFFHGKRLLKSLDFDAMSYSHDTLSQLVIEIFIEVRHARVISIVSHDEFNSSCTQQMELDTRLGLDRSILEAFVLAVQSRMLENPYHNWIHACDVAQAREAFLTWTPCRL